MTLIGRAQTPLRLRLWSLRCVSTAARPAQHRSKSSLTEETQPDTPTTFLVDGTLVAYRAFNGFPVPLRSKSGRDTRAVYGFLRFLSSLFRDFQPQRIAVVFDSPRPAHCPSLRSEVLRLHHEGVRPRSLLKQAMEAVSPSFSRNTSVSWTQAVADMPVKARSPRSSRSRGKRSDDTSPSEESYKAHRASMQPELAAGIADIERLLDALGISCFHAPPQLEADDLLSALARYVAARGDNVRIISGDKDLLQEVGPNVSILRPAKRLSNLELIDESGFVEEHGIHPKQLVDVLALAGDAADNIGGLDGIGPKTALKLVRQFGTVEALARNLDQVSSEALKRTLRQQHRIALVNKRLIQLHPERVPRRTYSRTYPLSVSEPDVDGLASFCSSLDIATVWKDLAQRVERAAQLEMDAMCVPEKKRAA